MERRGIVWRGERVASEGLEGESVETGRILPCATRPLRLAVLSLRLGALQPPMRSRERGT